MKKFEYKIRPIELKSLTKKLKVGIDIESTEAILIGDGLEGWEAISTFNDTGSTGQVFTYVLMKREIVNDF